jgi:hypothetical protein
LIKHILLHSGIATKTTRLLGALFEEMKHDTALSGLNARVWGLIMVLVNIIVELFEEIVSEAIMLIKMING